MFIFKKGNTAVRFPHCINTKKNHRDEDVTGQALDLLKMILAVLLFFCVTLRCNIFAAFLLCFLFGWFFGFSLRPRTRRGGRCKFQSKYCKSSGLPAVLPVPTTSKQASQTASCMQPRRRDQLPFGSHLWSTVSCLSLYHFLFPIFPSFCRDFRYCWWIMQGFKDSFSAFPSALF